MGVGQREGKKQWKSKPLVQWKEGKKGCGTRTDTGGRKVEYKWLHRTKKAPTAKEEKAHSKKVQVNLKGSRMGSSKRIT